LFALEVSEVLYGSVVVRIRDTAMLDSLLSCDIFSTTCTPRDHVRCLEVGLRFPGGDGHKSTFSAHVAQLQEVLTIKKLRGPSVRFVLRKDDLQYLSRFEEVTAPVVHALKSAGVVVTWSKSGDDGDVVGDLTVKKRDFTCTLQELKDDIAANSVFVSASTMTLRHH